MLFKQKHLEDIKSGKCSLAFRKWKKPSAKKGSLIKTSIGLVEIRSIEEVTLAEIKPADAGAAGFKNTEELFRTLDAIPEGKIYKIGVRYHSPDPRIALRQQTSITDDMFNTIKTRLDRLERYAGENWIKGILLAIQQHPRLRAADLALITGREKEWLKLNIRKLKNLGLTISYHPGYELSPLGDLFLEKRSSADQRRSV
jgi:hypothetical protein